MWPTTEQLKTHCKQNTITLYWQRQHKTAGNYTWEYTRDGWWSSPVDWHVLDITAICSAVCVCIYTRVLRSIPIVGTWMCCDRYGCIYNLSVSPTGLSGKYRSPLKRLTRRVLLYEVPYSIERNLTTYYTVHSIYIYIICMVYCIYTATDCTNPHYSYQKVYKQ